MRKLFWLLTTVVLGLAACDASAPDASETLSAALRAPTERRGVASGDAARVLLANRTLDASADGAGLPAGLEAAGPGLFVMHFAGPVRGAWRDGLVRAGLAIVDYVPANAYVVYGLGADVARAWAAVGALDLVAPFEIGDKRSPMLQVPAEPSAPVDVTLVVVEHPAARDTLAAVDAATTEVLTRDRTLAGKRFLGRRVAASALGGLVARPDVVWIEPWLLPELDDEVQDQILAGAHDGLAPTGPGYRAWLDAWGLTGLDAVIVDVCDSGLDTGETSPPHHPDLGGRYAFCNNFVTSETSCDDGCGHGTINAGIVGGDATAGTGVTDPAGYLYGEGVAPGVRFGASAIFSNSSYWGAGSASGTDFIGAAWAAGARISTNSWGSHAYGAYTTTSAEYDALVRDADLDASNGLQPMAVFFSAGNDGSGSYSIGAPATGKNVISVGASENYRMNGADGCGIADTGADAVNDLISFSSRGPTKDGRLKPEIVAPGTHVQGAASSFEGYQGGGVCDTYWPANQTLYARSSGTSHSCPAAAGAGALLYAWVQAREGVPPSPALLKAMLVAHSADMSGGADGKSGVLAPRPSPEQGFGRIDLSTAFDPGVERVIVDQAALLQEPGDAHELLLVRAVDPLRPVVVVLAWTDAPGATTGASYNNDLDLEVSAGASTWYGNVFSGGWSVTGGQHDLRNNVEAVFLPAGAATLFALRVLAANLPSDGVPGNDDETDQDFALYVVNGTTQSPRGFVGFDDDAYGCSDQAVVTVSDEDLVGAGTVAATVSSDSEPAGEEVTLVEIAPDTGVFRAPVALRPTPTPPGDGALQAADGGTLVARYLDADDGSGQAVEAVVEAALDCRGPEIFGVVLERRVTEVRVAWRTDEPATSKLVYAFGTGPDKGTTAPTLTREHELLVSPLPDCKDLRVKIEATDRHGNVGADDNGGLRYHQGTGQQWSVLYAPLDDSPGWELTGTWAFGAPLGSCGDPTTAYSGTNVYGTALTTCYTSSSTSTLTTPVFTLHDTPAQDLTFARWVRVETGYDVAEVLLGEGNKWTSLWSSKNRGEVKDTAWVLERFDLSRFAGKSVRLRWSLTTDSWVTDGGWNLDDARVTARLGCPGDNVPPACVLTAAPLVGLTPLAVAFDAAGSADADGAIVRATWDFGDGTWVTGLAAAHVYPTRGRYTARLSLVDDDGAVGSCSVEIKANEAPRACFLADAELVQQGETVNFDAACSADVDGSIASYAWDFGDGATASGQKTSHLFATAGVYTARLTVTDDNGAAVEAGPVTITVNAPPTAVIEWFPAVPQVDEIVRFDAGASTDPDGQVKNWAWGFGDAASEDDTGTPLHAYGDPGLYTVTLEILDNWGGRATATEQLRINAPPVATFSASPSGSIVQGASVLFDASQSRDLDGTLAGLVWDFGDGEQGAGPTPSHAYLCPGSYVVRLEAIDDDGAIDAAERALQVKNVAPRVTLPDDLGGVEGTPLLLEPEVQEVCPESPLAWLWKLGDGAHATTPFASHAWADDGAYVVTACARDPQNAEGCDEAQVVIANAPPVVSAGPDRAASQGEVVVFSGSFSDPGGLDTHTVAWDFGDGSSHAGSLSPAHTFTAVGAHTVRLQVEDDDGGAGTDTLVVHVANAPPIVDAGPDRSAREGEELWLSAVASDPGGDPLELRWDLGDGAVGTGPGPFAHTFVDNGLYAVTVRALDPLGGAASDTAWISVSNQPPAADAGPALAGLEGDLLSFSGVASDLGPADTLSYAWSFGDGGLAATRVATHVYRDQGTYTATFTVLDDDGGVGSDGVEVVLANAPPRALAGGDALVDEGSAARFWGQASDPGAADVLTVDWRFDDGASALGALVVEHVFRDDGAFAVAFTVTDDEGASASADVPIEVRNVAPRVDAGPDRAAREGEPVSLPGGFSDPGADDTHAVHWDFGDGNELDGQVAPVHAWACAGNFQAELSVTDDDGGLGTDAVAVSIANVAPSLDAGKDRAVAEGAEVAFAASVSDPCPSGVPDASSAVWDLGDGSIASGSLSLSHRFVDDGTYTVSVTLPDPFGGSVTDTVQVSVSNTSPVVEAGADAEADEGADVTFTGGYLDAGANDRHLVAWQFGDGASASTAAASHAYADDGAYTATLVVTDDDGAAGSDQRTVLVHNLPPRVEAGVDLEVGEGGSVPLTGVVSDPGVADALTATWSFGDGGSATGATVWHAWADDGSYEATLTVTDDDGASTADALGVLVLNLPPVVDAGPDRLVVQGQPVLLEGSAVDPGPLDVVTLRWDFGDGASADDTDAPVHAWGTPAAYAVTLTARDDDGAEASDQARVTVTNAPPSVTLAPIAPVPEGTAVSLTGSASDPGGDTLTLAWDLGDGSHEAGAASVTHAWADDGRYTVCLNATDPSGSTARACVDVVVTNGPPLVSSSPQGTALEGVPYTYDLAAADPAGDLDPLTYWLEARPAGMTLDALTGRLAWTPSETDVCGPTPVLVRVQDDDGGVAYQSFTIAVTNLDDAPVITSVAPDSAVQGYLWTYAPRALDPDVEAGCVGDELSWSLLEAPDGVEQDPLTGVLSWTPGNLDVGTRTLRLGVTDTSGLTDEQVLTVVVSADPRAPVALAGVDRAVEPGVATLDGSASGPAGTLAAWEWALASGPEEADLSGCGAAACDVTLLARGDYVFRLVVIDLGGHASPPDTVTLTVQNAPPIADAGLPRVVPLGAPVDLDASGSSDLNGDPLEASWEVLDAPGGSTAPVEVAADGSASLTPDRVGAWLLGLRVGDGEATSELALVQVMAVDPVGPDYPPVAMIVPAEIVAAVGEPVTLDGGASHDAEGTPVTYSWQPLASPAPLTLVPADQPTVTFTPTAAGLYRVGLVATSGGAASWRAEARVVVVGDEALPVAEAGPDQRAPVGGVAVLDGSASTSGGGAPPRFSWRQTGGGLLRLDDPASPTPSFQVFRPGRADLQLVVSSQSGLASPPDRVSVYRVTGDNHAPTPVATAPAFAWAWDDVVLDGGSSIDPDGDPLALAWVQTAGPPALLDDWRAPVTTVRPTSWGELRFALVAFDGELQSLPTEVTLRVASPNNRPPEADAGPDAEGAPGGLVTLDGSGSHDPEGAALTWAWTQVDGPSVELADAAGPTPTFVPDQEGSYLFRLVVADLLFQSAPDDVRVDVREPVPEPVEEETEAEVVAPDALEAEAAPEPQPETSDDVAVDVPVDVPAKQDTPDEEEPGVELVEPLPDAQRPDTVEPEPDVHIPLDALHSDATEEPEGEGKSGGGGGCTVGGGGVTPTALGLLAIGLLAVALRRRRPAA
jgi:PKD repeat protein